MIEKEIRELLQSISIHTRKNYTASLREHGLHIGQELALHHLWQKDGITQAALRHKIGSEASTVSNMLRKLEQDGIVYRKKDEHDNRATNIFLTEKGKQLREPVEQMWKNHEKRLFANLLDEELILLRRLLIQMESDLLSEKNNDINS